MTVNRMHSQSLRIQLHSHESRFIVCLSESALEAGLFRRLYWNFFSHFLVGHPPADCWSYVEFGQRRHIYANIYVGVYGLCGHFAPIGVLQLVVGRDQALHITRVWFRRDDLAMARVTGDQFSLAAVTLKTCCKFVRVPLQFWLRYMTASW